MQLVNTIEEHLSQGPPQNWVRLIALPETNFPIDPSQVNLQWLLIDRQENLKEKTFYFHFVAKILDSLGVQELSNLFFSFDPLYQKLVFHDVFIVRSNQRIDKLQLDKVKIMQREERLEAGIYDGRNQATLFLEDVRPGDILEYAYSIIGSNPIFEGKYSCSFSLQYTARIERLHHRILLKDEFIALQHHPQHFEEYLTRDELDWTWQLQPSLPYLPEPEQPDGLIPYGYVEFTEYQSWKEIVKWAQPLYEWEEKNDAQIAKLVQQWMKESESLETKALKALRFVQNEIRYLGFEMGIYGMKPAQPDEVFYQRFGDCKGKSQLLRYLLEKMGIRSYPCLVFSHDRYTARKSLPRPGAFNHVIVCIELSDGMRFVDPTMIYQGGTLHTLECPDYGYGLVIAENTTSLTPIPTLAPKKKIEINSLFDLYQEPVNMDIHASYYAGRADRMRYRVKQQGILDLAREYEQYYGALFGLIEADPLKIKDDEEQNILQIQKKYRILNFWSAARNGKNETTLYPNSFQSYLTRSIDANRKTPLALSHPLCISETIRLNGFNLKIKNKEVHHPAFSFFRVKKEKNLVVYQLVTHRDSVEPADLIEYAQKLKEAWDNCQIIIRQSGKKNRFKWWKILLYILFLGNLLKNFAQ